jgi:hypothetical protein
MTPRHRRRLRAYGRCARHSRISYTARQRPALQPPSLERIDETTLDKLAWASDAALLAARTWRDGPLVKIATEVFALGCLFHQRARELEERARLGLLDEGDAV